MAQPAVEKYGAGRSGEELGVFVRSNLSVRMWPILQRDTQRISRLTLLGELRERTMSVQKRDP